MIAAIDIGAWFETIYAWLQNAWANLSSDFYLNFIKEDRWKYLVRGLGVTLEVAFFAAIAGIVLGALLAIIRTTADKAGRTLAVHMYALLSNGLYTEEAYATAVVLLVMVIGINALSGWLAKKVSAKQGE